MSDEPLMLIDPEILQGIEGVVKHIVKPGDSLKGLAKSIGVDWEELAQLNYGTTDPKAIKWYIQRLLGNEEDPGDDFAYHIDGIKEPVFVLLPTPFAVPEKRKSKAPLVASRYEPGAKGKASG